MPTRPGLPERLPTLLRTRRGPIAFVPLEGLTTWVKPAQPMPPPSTLASSTPITMPLRTLPALPPTRRLSSSSSLPLTPLLPHPTPLSPTRLRPYATNLQSGPGAAEEGGAAAMTQTRRGDLTLWATACPMTTTLAMVTMATPALKPRKATRPPPFATTSWAAPLPISTGMPNRPI